MMHRRLCSQVSTIIGRTNTVNGRQYNTDPTIFAWEVHAFPIQVCFYLFMMN